MARCPTCGQPELSKKDDVFGQLRNQAADANDRADKAEDQVERLKEERDGLKVRNADLRAGLKEAKVG